MTENMVSESQIAMIYEHDKHIDSLTASVHILVDNLSDTNTKLDKVVTAISIQNVLAEKLNNFEKTFITTKTEMKARVEEIETKQNSFIPANAIRFVTMFFLTYIIAFGIYTSTHLQNLEVEISTNSTKQQLINETTKENIDYNQEMISQCKEYHFESLKTTNH